MFLLLIQILCLLKKACPLYRAGREESIEIVGLKIISFCSDSGLLVPGFDFFFYGSNTDESGYQRTDACGSHRNKGKIFTCKCQI